MWGSLIHWAKKSTRKTFRAQTTSDGRVVGLNDYGGVRFGTDHYKQFIPCYFSCD